jgi:aconitate hydratase
VIDIAGLAGDGPPPHELSVTAGGTTFGVRVRIDTPKEAEYYRHGGILQYVVRQLAG